MKRRHAQSAAAAMLAFLTTPASGAVIGAPARDNFNSSEETYLDAASSGDPKAVLALAEFYAAYDLWPEALATIKRSVRPDAAGEALQIEALYRLGRFSAAAAAAEGKHALSAFRAMALTRLGAYEEAAAIFAKASPPPGFDAEHHLLSAEASAFAKDASRALKALDAAVKAGLPKSETARLQFVRGQIHRAQGEEARASTLFERAARGLPDDWSMRARAALAQTVDDLAPLALMWRSEAFDRDVLMREAAIALESADYERGLGALSRAAARFPQSDAALAAQATIGAALADLFAADLPPEKAARLFFAHVSFAPPGREGDALIRQAADRLKTLGLFAEAAALLDHQVFKRLRGAERSRVAADLADLQLEARTPEAALRTLRATRIAGLDGATIARRRLLEATALARLGRSDAALSLLENADSPAEKAARAAINWDAERWSDAAGDYAAVFSAEPENRHAAMRAATAFLLAGDRAGYRAFAGAGAPQLDGTPEGDVIKAMGSVDRDAFLGDFMTKYRALYGAKAGES
jgi:tetratricopeptide (TPR) repeat protein